MGWDGIIWGWVRSDHMGGRDGVVCDGMGRDGVG